MTTTFIVTDYYGDHACDCNYTIAVAATVTVTDVTVTGVTVTDYYGDCDSESVTD